MRRLKAHVHVSDDAGQSHVFGPDDQVPDWAAEKITNPAAWDGDAPADGPSDEQDAPTDEPPDDEDGPADGDAPDDGPPPQSGRGGGRAAWAAYAAANDVEVADGATRDDIIAALNAAGVPTVRG